MTTQNDHAQRTTCTNPWDGMAVMGSDLRAELGRTITTDSDGKAPLGGTYSYVVLVTQ
jgi:hypothetical protein